MLEVVTLHDAHTVPHGMMQKLFEKSFDNVFKSLYSSAVKNFNNISGKILKDRFIKFYVDRRFTNNVFFAMSGTIENVAECEQLLEDVNEMMGEERVEKKMTKG